LRKTQQGEEVWITPIFKNSFEDGVEIGVESMSDSIADHVLDPRISLSSPFYPNKRGRMRQREFWQRR